MPQPEEKNAETALLKQQKYAHAAHSHDSYTKSVDNFVDKVWISRKKRTELSFGWWLIKK